MLGPQEKVSWEKAFYYLGILLRREKEGDSLLSDCYYLGRFHQKKVGQMHGEDIHDYATKKLLVVPSTHGCLQTMQKRVAWASKKK